MHKEIIFHEKGRDSMYKLWHNSSDNMIIYMHSDGGNIVFNDKIYPIKKGVLCFIGAKKYHYTMPNIPELYDRSKIFVSAEQSLKILSSFPTENYLFKTFSSNSVVYAQIPEDVRPEVEKLFFSAEEIKNNGKYFEAQLFCSYINLLIYLDMYTQEPSASVSEFAFNAIEYINKHIQEELTIDKICSYLHMSKYHFCRKFKALTSLTVMEYILKTRLTLATNFLVNEDISIGNISEKCGFSSVSYFCRIFKENTGKSPLQYRKKHFE